MLTTRLFLIAAVSMPSIATAQQATPETQPIAKVTLAGYVETYYQLNFDTPASRTCAASTTASRARRR